MPAPDETEKEYLNLQQTLISYSLQQFRTIKETWLNFSASEQNLKNFLQANSEFKLNELIFLGRLKERMSAAKRLSHQAQQFSDSIASLLKALNDAPKETLNIAEYFAHLDIIYSHRKTKAIVPLLALEAAIDEKCPDWLKARNRDKRKAFDADFLVNDLTPTHMLKFLPLSIEAFKPQFQAFLKAAIERIQTSILTKDEEAQLNAFILNLNLALRYIDQTLNKVWNIIWITLIK